MLHSLVRFVNLARAVAGGKKVVARLQKRKSEMDTESGQKF